MTERQAVRFLRRGDGASVILFPDLGQRPLQALLNEVLPSMVQGSPTSRASAFQSTTPPILTTRMPLFEIFKEGRRPIRDVTSQFIMGLYQPQEPDIQGKLLREKEEKAKAEEKDKRAAAYSAIENSVIIAG